MTARRTARAALWVGVVVMAVVLVGGCGDEPAPPSEHGHEHAHDTHVHDLPRGDGPVAGEGPDASATEALTRIYSWAPVTDADSGAGMRRATAWLSGELAAVARRGDGGDQLRPMRSWSSWQQDKAIVTATVKVTAQQDRPGATDVTRRALVAQQVQRPDGSVEPLGVMTFDVALSHDRDQRWRMWRMQLVDMSVEGDPQ